MRERFPASEEDQQRSEELRDWMQEAGGGWHDGFGFSTDLQEEEQQLGPSMKADAGQLWSEHGGAMYRAGRR